MSKHKGKPKAAAGRSAQAGTAQQHPAGWVQVATPQLEAWIREQMQAGCSAADLLAALLAAGWEGALAQATINRVAGAPVAAAPWLGAAPKEAPAPSVRADTAKTARAVGMSDAMAKALAGIRRETELLLPEPAIADGRNRLIAEGREVTVLGQMKLPRVVVFEGLLSDDECDAMVEAARARLVRSETVVVETGESSVNAARTSEGMFFHRGENPLCERIEARLSALLNWPVSHGEGLQVLRYGVGAEYRPHYDYFDPAQPGTPTIVARGGQRVGTIVMYLNTPRRGGATTFPDVGYEVAAIKGNAVFFSYDRADPATKTLHGGAPVLEGEKWVATKWLREGVFT